MSSHIYKSRSKYYGWSRDNEVTYVKMWTNLISLTKFSFSRSCLMIVHLPSYPNTNLSHPWILTLSYFPIFYQFYSLQGYSRHCFQYAYLAQVTVKMSQLIFMSPVFLISVSSPYCCQSNHSKMQVWSYHFLDKYPPDVS